MKRREDALALAIFEGFEKVIHNEHDVLIQQVVGAPDRISLEQMGRLPFGAFELDLDGIVLAFNAHEETASQKREDVIGKSFFAIAPFTNVKKFRFQFTAHAKDHSLNERFEFVFKLGRRERLVGIWMVYSEITKTVWVFVTLGGREVRCPVGLGAGLPGAR